MGHHLTVYNRSERFSSSWHHLRQVLLCFSRKSKTSHSAPVFIKAPCPPRFLGAQFENHGTGSDLPAAFPTRRARAHHGASRASLAARYAHTWVPHGIPVLRVGRCPVCCPRSQRPPAASDPLKIFQLRAHWKCLRGLFSCLLFLCGQILSTCRSHCRWRPAIS